MVGYVLRNLAHFGSGNSENHSVWATVK